MKNIITLCLLLVVGISTAQQNRYERIKALKVAHLTEALDLSAEEAQKFWPVYNAQDEKLHDIKKRERKEIMARLHDGGLDKLTDAEANELIDLRVQFDQEMAAQKTEMITKLRKVLSPKKVLKLHKAEDDFKKTLLERFKRKKGK